MNTYIYILIGLNAVLLVMTVVLLISSRRRAGMDQEIKEGLEDFKGDIYESNHQAQRSMLDMVQRQLETSEGHSAELQKRLNEGQMRLLEEFSGKTERTLSLMSSAMTEKLGGINRQNEAMRQTVDRKLTEMSASNEKKLEEMRATVDEKLQKTLDERLAGSFSLVSERLEQVYASLGEMQKVGQGVDDLKKVLSNVKSRGILGETRLGAILEDILSPDQYLTNVATRKGSKERVEFAVKMPGMAGETVLLPIDSKFPLDAYARLVDAYDSADPARVSLASKELRSRILKFAKDIREKYIDVPNTTEFAVMFLPTEGLYAEVVRMGMVEELQKEKINVAGPTTMAALLNSLQMGFRTLAIQKNSSMVWQVLGEVKTEFEKFGSVLETAQNRMRQTGEELDKLVGVRTKEINRRLSDVQSFSTRDFARIRPPIPKGILDDGEEGLFTED